MQGSWMFLAGLCGCFETEGRTALEQEEVRTAMADHWSDAVAARDALIDGDVPRARKAARRIAGELGDEPLPGVVAPYVSRVVVLAERAATTSDVTTAATAVGEMAWQCGSCHVAAEAVLDIDEPPVAASDPEMVRHQAAVQTLWAGLLTHDDATLSAGAALLAEAPLARSHNPPVVAELERGVHELAPRIASSADVEKGTHFGELLTTCATCHALVRDDRRHAR